MPDKLKVLFTSKSQNMNFFSTFFLGGGGGEIATRIGSSLGDLIEQHVDLI